MTARSGILPRGGGVRLAFGRSGTMPALPPVDVMPRPHALDRLWLVWVVWWSGAWAWCLVPSRQALVAAQMPRAAAPQALN